MAATAPASKRCMHSQINANGTAKRNHASKGFDTHKLITCVVHVCVDNIMPKQDLVLAQCCFAELKMLA